MFKNILNKIYIYIPFLITIFFVSISWNYIEFNYINPNEIIGYYSIFEHSYLNDNFRYIFFISLPLIVYTLTIILSKKIDLVFLKQILNFEKENQNSNTLENRYIFFFLSLIIIFFFSEKFNANPVDLFHEGQAILGALNFKESGNLWSNSFVVTSLFIDILNANISWKLTNIQSISSYRFFIKIITSITAFIIFLFLFKISNKVELNRSYKLILFIMLCIFSYSLLKNFTFSFREIPIFLFLIMSFNYLVLEKKNFFLFLILGILPIFSLLWSLDRGIFLCACYIAFFFILLVNKKFKDTLVISSLIIFSILIFFIFIGKNEFIFFIKNSFDILSSSDLLNGIIHPAPFSKESGSSRATKSLLIIILNGIIIINYLFSNQKNLSKNFIIFLTLFFILSVIYYKIGVTRSDGGHIKQGASLSFLLFFFFVIYNFLFYIEKKKFLKFKKFNFVRYLNIFLIILFVNINIPQSFFNNIFTFNNRLAYFLNTPDRNFLKKSELELINKLEDLTKNDKCFQVFSYETIIPYYLKKPSCTKFYHIMNMGPKKNQLVFNEELKNSNTEIILTGGTYKNIGNMKGRDQIELSPSDRFPYISEYINDNFKLLEKFDEWDILIKK